MNTTIKTWEALLGLLENTNPPQCFTVNYLPDTDEYALWIGNQPYYHYEKLIELEEEEKKELQDEVKQLKKLLILQGKDPADAKKISYAKDIRTDLKYGLETDGEYVPKTRDIDTLNWLIQQATKIEMYKYALALIANEDNGRLGFLAKSSLYEAEHRFDHVDELKTKEEG